MHSFGVYIYDMSGLEHLGSPWLSILVLFILFGLALSPLALLFDHLKQRTKAQSLSRSVGVILLLGLFFLFELLTVTLQSFIVARNQLADDVPFTAYGISLLLLANVPFWFLLWKRGVFKSDENT